MPTNAEWRRLVDGDELTLWRSEFPYRALMKRLQEVRVGQQPTPYEEWPQFSGGKSGFYRTDTEYLVVLEFNDSEAGFDAHSKLVELLGKFRLIKREVTVTEPAFNKVSLTLHIPLLPVS